MKNAKQLGYLDLEKVHCLFTMNAEGFKTFLSVCKIALNEDSQPMAIMKLIRKRYKECDKAFIDSPEFFDLLTTSHAKILNDRSKFLMYLKHFCDVLKKNKCIQTASESIKRPLDTDDTSDSEVEQPAKRLKLNTHDKNDGDYDVEKGKRAIDVGKVQNGTSGIHDNGDLVGDYIDDKDKTANPEMQDDQVYNGDDISDEVKDHLVHGSMNTDDADLVKVSPERTKPCIESRDIKKKDCTEINGKERIYLDSTLETESHSDDGLGQIKKMPYLDITIESDSSSVNEPSCSSKKPNTDKPSKLSGAHPRFNDEETDESVVKVISQKHRTSPSDSNKIKHYSSSSSSEDDNFWTRLKKKKDKKTSKYRITVGKCKSKKIDRQTSSTYINSTGSQAKQSGLKNCSSPRKNSPKFKSPKTSPKKSPPRSPKSSLKKSPQKSPQKILIITDSDSETEVEIVKAKKRAFGITSEVEVKLTKINMEECEAIEDGITDPNVSHSDQDIKEESSVDDGEIQETEMAIDEESDTNGVNDKKTKGTEANGKTPIRRVPLVTEVLYDSLDKGFKDPPELMVEKSNKQSDREDSEEDCVHSESKTTSDVETDRNLDKSQDELKHSNTEQSDTTSDGAELRKSRKDKHKSPLSERIKSRDEVRPSTSTETSDKSVKAGKGSSKQIIRLEKLLEQIRDKIEKVRRNELDLDDLDSDISDYILEDKLQQKFVKVWNKLCELHNSASSTGRPTEKKFIYQGLRYPDINKKIERFVNKRKVFPDFHDVRDIIIKVNRDKKLHLSSKHIDDLSREAFTEVGNKLQDRRKEDLALTMTGGEVERFSIYDDPALYDTDLKRKLDSNKKVAKTNIQKVVDKFAHLQYEVGEEEDEEEDDDEDEEEEEDFSKENHPRKEIDTEVVRLLDDNEGLEIYDSNEEGNSNHAQSNGGDSKHVMPITPGTKDNDVKPLETYDDNKSQFFGENFGLHRNRPKPTEVISIDSDDDDDKHVKSDSDKLLNHRAEAQRDGSQNASSAEGNRGSDLNDQQGEENNNTGSSYQEEDLIVIDVDEGDECYENPNNENIDNVDGYDGDEYYEQYDYNEDEYYGQNRENTYPIEAEESVVVLDEDDPEPCGDETVVLDEDDPEPCGDETVVLDEEDPEPCSDQTSLVIMISSPRHVSENDHLHFSDSMKTNTKHLNNEHQNTKSVEDVCIDLVDDNEEQTEIDCHHNSVQNVHEENMQEIINENEVIELTEPTINNPVTENIKTDKGCVKYDCEEDKVILADSDDELEEGEIIYPEDADDEEDSTETELGEVKDMQKYVHNESETEGQCGEGVLHSNTDSVETECQDFELISDDSSNDSVSKNNSSKSYETNANVGEEEHHNSKASDEGRKYYNKGEEQDVDEGHKSTGHDEISNPDNITDSTKSESERKKPTDSLGSWLSFVKLDDLATDDDNSQFDSIPDIFDNNDDDDDCRNYHESNDNNNDFCDSGDVIHDNDDDNGNDKDSGSVKDKDGGSGKDKDSGSGNDKDSGSDKDKDSGSDNDKDSGSGNDSGSDNESGGDKDSGSDNESDNDNESGSSQCSESLLSGARTFHEKEQTNNSERISLNQSDDNANKSSPPCYQKNESLNSNNSVKKGPVHRTYSESTKPLLNHVISCKDGSSSQAEVVEMKDHIDTSPDFICNGDIVNDDYIEINEENILSNNDEEVVSNTSDNDEKVTSTIGEYAEKIKHPDVRNKLIQLHNNVEKAEKTRKISDGSRKSINNKNYCDRSRVFLSDEDENIDLIENYEEPTSFLFKAEDTLISSSVDHEVIELSDSE